MKIRVVSDLHLEFLPLEIPNNHDIDVLVLSGDIMTAIDLHDHSYEDYRYRTNMPRPELSDRYRDFLHHCSKHYKHVIYVAGNHEFYNGYWNRSIEHLKEECENYSNIYFLEKDYKTIDGVTFVGCTLWTNMNKRNPMTIHSIATMFNDFRLIRDDKNNYRKITTNQILDRHDEHMKFLSDSVKMFDNIVVCTHMAPCVKSIHEHFKHDFHGNGFYHSELSEFILDNPKIKLWTHGHVHNSFDYMIGDTRVVCNPRGYAVYEPNTGFDSNHCIELGN